MAMRMYTIKELHNELRKHGLAPTGQSTKTQDVWCVQEDKKNTFLVPKNRETVQDYILDCIISNLGKLYTASDSSVQKEYTVEGKKIDTHQVIDIQSKKLANTPHNTSKLKKK